MWPFSNPAIEVVTFRLRGWVCYTEMRKDVVIYEMWCSPAVQYRGQAHFPSSALATVPAAKRFGLFVSWPTNMAVRSTKEYTLWFHSPCCHKATWAHSTAVSMLDRSDSCSASKRQVLLPLYPPPLPPPHFPDPCPVPFRGMVIRVLDYPGEIRTISKAYLSANMQVFS